MALCECGCGQPTTIPIKTNHKKREELPDEPFIAALREAWGEG